MRIGEGAAKFLWPITPSINVRYRLKFGDAFAVQTFQVINMRYIYR